MEREEAHDTSEDGKMLTECKTDVLLDDVTAEHAKLFWPCKAAKTLGNTAHKECFIALAIAWDKTLSVDCQRVEVIDEGVDATRELETGEVSKGDKVFVAKLLLVWQGIAWIMNNNS